MSYAAAAALQTALYARLSGWPALAGVAMVDAMPTATAPETFVLIGPEAVADQSDKTGAGAEHRFEVAVISTATGFLSAKTVAAAVSQALVGANLTLSAGHLVGITFQRAVARRLDEGTSRRIDLTFRARIEF